MLLKKLFNKGRGVQLGLDPQNDAINLQIKAPDFRARNPMAAPPIPPDQQDYSLLKLLQGSFVKNNLPFFKGKPRHKAELKPGRPTVLMSVYVHVTQISLIRFGEEFTLLILVLLSYPHLRLLSLVYRFLNVIILSDISLYLMT